MRKEKMKMKIALVTGASSGIGREFVRQLAAREEIDGFWLVARSRERLEETARMTEKPCEILTADLGTPEGIAAVEEKLVAEKPTVSVLVNAAGFGVFGAFDQLEEKTVAGMIDLNVKALVLLTHATIPYMPRGGRIIEMGSGSCFTPLPYFNIYSSSKVFVLHYTKSLNYELRRYGVRATCFCPGWVETPFLPKSKANAGVPTPKSMKPLLAVDRVVRGCLAASQKGKTMYVTGVYTKFQHLLFKLLPDRILTRLWLGMLRTPDGKKPE